LYANWRADGFGDAPPLQMVFHHRFLLQRERAFQQAGFDLGAAAFHRFPVKRRRERLDCLSTKQVCNIDPPGPNAGGGDAIIRVFGYTDKG